MHPDFLKLGGFEIRWYGVMIALGFLAAVWLGTRRARKAGFSADLVPNASFWIILGGFAGARLLYVVLNWEQYASDPVEILRIDHGGIVYYGGFLGGLGATLLYCRKARINFWSFADVMAPPLALAHAFGRIGCFLNGCCWGGPCDFFWGVHFPPGSPAAMSGQLGAVHPTQLYEAAYLFYLCAALLVIDAMKKFQGQTLASYGLLYSLFRFVVEYWRGDVPTYFHLTVAQWISIAVFGISWWWLTRQRKRWILARRFAAIAEMQKMSGTGSTQGGSAGAGGRPVGD